MRNRRLRRGVIATAIVALTGGIGLVGIQAASADDKPTPSATQTEQDGSAGKPEGRASTGTAAGAPLSGLLTQIDGTAPFDKGDEAGYDSSASNGIIRTNDTMTFRVEVRSEGKTKQNATIRIPLQAGLEAQKLPPYCKANSSTTPDALPEPGSAELPIPITKDSWKSLPAQEIVCNVGTLQPAATFLYSYTAKVRSEVPNGTVIKTKAFVKADGETEIATGEVSTKVSARAKFNVTTNSWQGTENTGYFYNEFTACSFDPSRQCSRFQMPIMVTVPGQGGKGTSPAQSPMTFDYDLSPESYFYKGVIQTDEWKAAGAGAMEQYAPRILRCTSAYDSWWQHPSGKIGAIGPEKAVRNTGTVACNQPKLGDPMKFTLTGADTTAYTTPTKVVHPKDMAIPADRAYVASIIAYVEVPNAAIVDLGKGEPSRRAMEIDGFIRNFNPVGIDGVTNDPTADAAFDNHRMINRVITFGDGFAKYYAGFPNDPNNVPPEQYKPGWATHPGVAGASSVWAGDGIVLPGQRALSTLHFSLATPAGGPTSSRLACDTWDNNMLSLAAGDYAKDPKVLGYQFPSEGKAAWVSAYYTRDGGGYASDPNEAKVSIEYGSGPVGVGDNSRCGDSDSVTGWVTDPAQVPGNDPELAAKGIYTAVNKVRAYTQMTPRVDGRQDLWVAIALEARANPLDGGEDFKVGTPIPNYSAIIGKNADVTKEELLASGAEWSLSTYEKEDASGSNGDRLLVGTAIARISKEVTDPKTGGWTAGTPAFQAGDEISYRLTPSLTAGASSVIKPAVSVEDCLPADLIFLDSKPAASIAKRGPQDDAELKCQDDETYIKWELGPQEINGAIDPIVYTTRVASTSSNGSKVNTTAVIAENELSKLARRTAINTVIINSPAGVKLEKQAVEPVVEVNRTDGATKRDMKWQVSVVNVGDMPNISNVDVIDVLPRTGVNDTKFKGSLALKDIKTVKGKNVTLAYTADTKLEQDPTNARNSATGATTWCDAMSDGKVISGSGAKSTCPTGVKSVTGMRIMRAGAFAPADAFTVEVTMTADGNADADIYINRAMAQAKGLTLPFGPINAPIRAVSSSIGDYVWLDDNSDGVQSEGEVGIANIPVTLTGTDSVGNKVSLSTKTGTDGKYGFANLTAGDYTLHFEAKDRDFSPAKIGADPAADSDVDASGNVAFALSQGKEDLTLDAGILPIPSAKVSKSVVNLTHPGEKARPGDVLRYKIIGENASKGAFTAARPAVIVDDLTEVLDDADLQGEPLYALTGKSHPEPKNPEDPTDPVDPAAVVGTLKYAEPKLTWSGPLLSGDKVTITYEAVVKAQDDLGDKTAINFVRLGTSEPPPGTGPCTQEEMDAGLCDSTTTPMAIGDLDVRKLVETKPGSGSFIEADDTDGLFGEYVVGDTVTWQIKVTNTGEYPLTDIKVTDPLVPSCNKVIALLEPGHDAIYECTSKAEAGMTNVVTASAVGPDGKEFVATDPASIKVGPAPIVATEKVAITGSNVMLMVSLSVLIVGLGAGLLVLRRRGFATHK